MLDVKLTFHVKRTTFHAFSLPDSFPEENHLSHKMLKYLDTSSQTKKFIIIYGLLAYYHPCNFIECPVFIKSWKQFIVPL